MAIRESIEAEIQRDKERRDNPDTEQVCCITLFYDTLRIKYIYMHMYVLHVYMCIHVIRIHVVTFS